MPRIARMVAVGYPHHITQRGNYRQDIFHDDADREKYLRFIQNESERYGLKILVYCLMTNHVHLIGVPQHEHALGNVFKYVNMKYSQYYNKKRGMVGHLFQGRFFSSIMDTNHTVVCARYIERNPVRANLVKEAYHYEWSSARVHCGKETADIFGVDELFDYSVVNKGEWQDFIKQLDNPQDIDEIRNQTRNGRALGDESFIKKLECILKRRLMLLSVGRPKKNK